MATLARSTDAPWRGGARMPMVPALAGDLHVDVCIVGAGIAGLSVAYLLTKAGKKVAVVDDGQIGGGQTQVTTAHLSNAIDCHYVNVERVHGVDAARMVAESHTAAIDRIEQIARDEGIHCDFERLDGYLFASPDDSSDLLERELAAAQRTGVVRASRHDRAPLSNWDTGPCICFESQAQFHPLKFLSGMARAVLRGGGRIYGKTHAEAVEGGLMPRVEAARGAVRADAVVIATNAPINDLLAIHTKQAPYLTYAVGIHVPRHAIERALFWDTADPYHYVRLCGLNGKKDEQEGELLIVGGEDHKTGQASDGEQRFERLEAWARERFTMLGTVAFNWAGQVMESNDGLAFIGRNPRDDDNVFVVTGDSGQGMTHGLIAGMLITDLILGRDNPWEAVYDPKRIRLVSAGQFVKEGLNMAAQYGAWVTPGELESTDELKPGHGAILRRGLKKVAAYRDDKGRLIERSAVCPHLGCIVTWNDVERTWDCPCHGSQFSPTGDVLNGPANSGLAEIEE